MGIDIYAKWNGYTEEDHEKQITGFSIEAGNAGYLRESYHGGPYATRILMPEAFDDEREHTCSYPGNHECEPCNGVPIPAATLRERLDAVVLAAFVREIMVYERRESPGVVALEDGGNDALLATLKDIFTNQIGRTYADQVPDDVAREAARRFEAWKNGGPIDHPAKSFVEFVELCEKKEAETGHPVCIYASY